jgi:hypothetical protein
MNTPIFKGLKITSIGRGLKWPLSSIRGSRPRKPPGLIRPHHPVSVTTEANVPIMTATGAVGKLAEVAAGEADEDQAEIGYSKIENAGHAEFF